ncbi:hypothetical protein MKW94_003236 [Papaver nudicaule]|uniref:FAD-binding domain-containing protein n=1 Tax=Papaver nudicaule TaxID=74823 RepID=A0AA41S6T3_PAPNU|nr:hypothetical protein [Papaver nudicaule]
MENVVMKEEVVIVGGGIAGLATALALKRVGVKSLVLERSNELRVTGAALTLFSNAWIALESLGVAHKLTSAYKPYEGGQVTDVASGVTKENTLTKNYKGEEWQATGLRAIHRRALLELRSIEKAKTRRDNDSFGVIVHLEDGTSVHTKWLGLKDVVHSGRCAVRGLGLFPEGHGLQHQIQQFVDTGRRSGIAPISNNEVYWSSTYQTIVHKDEEMAKGDPKVIQQVTLESVVGYPQVVKDAVKQSDMQSLSWAPLLFRYPWDVIFRRLSYGTITVAGDAMHPMTPDLGQGGCASLEDAVVLGRHIGNLYIRNGRTISQEDIEVEIEMYVKERRWRTSGLITASYLSGWVLQSGSSSRGVGWLMKFLRDTLFYKIVAPRLGGFLNYDCGKLPTASS